MPPIATTPRTLEQDLAEGVRTGDDFAFSELYTAMGEKVFRLLYRLTRDRDRAADLTHDTFVRVMERGHLYRDGGSLRGWVYRIATNLAMDLFRGRQVLGLDEASLKEETSRLPSGEDRLDLRDALAQLPAMYRAVLLLHDVDGYTHDEIALMLDIAAGTSKARLSRGRAQMRRLLEKES